MENILNGQTRPTIAERCGFDERIIEAYRGQWKRKVQTPFDRNHRPTEDEEARIKLRGVADESREPDKPGVLQTVADVVRPEVTQTQPDKPVREYSPRPPSGESPAKRAEREAAEKVAKASAVRMRVIRLSLGTINFLDMAFWLAGAVVLTNWWLGILLGGLIVSAIVAAQQLTQDPTLEQGADWALGALVLPMLVGCWLHYTTLFHYINEGVKLTTSKETVCWVFAAIVSFLSYLSLVIGRKVTGDKHRNFASY